MTFDVLVNLKRYIIYIFCFTFCRLVELTVSEAQLDLTLVNTMFFKPEVAYFSAAENATNK